jgi:hypothetical protein
MSRGVTYSGLLEKCPAISFTDRTVVCDAGSSFLCTGLQQSYDPASSPCQEKPRNYEKIGKDESGGSPPFTEMLQYSRHRLPLAHVRIKDFKSLDGCGERGPCDVCNGKYVHYIERLTKERERMKRKVFRMCRVCFARAQQREAARCIAMPGTDCDRDASVVSLPV